jgi:hypothetical protein
MLEAGVLILGIVCSGVKVRDKEKKDIDQKAA